MNPVEITETERLPLRVFAEKAYLDYSMYVVLDRALPNIADGDTAPAAVTTDMLMDMLLAKKRAGDRKAWLEEKGDRAEV